MGTPGRDSQAMFTVALNSTFNGKTDGTFNTLKYPPILCLQVGIPRTKCHSAQEAIAGCRQLCFGPPTARQGALSKCPCPGNKLHSTHLYVKAVNDDRIPLGKNQKKRILCAGSAWRGNNEQLTLQRAPSNHPTAVWCSKESPDCKP